MTVAHGQDTRPSPWNHLLVSHHLGYLGQFQRLAKNQSTTTNNIYGKGRPNPPPQPPNRAAAHSLGLPRDGCRLLSKPTKCSFHCILQCFVHTTTSTADRCDTYTPVHLYTLQSAAQVQSLQPRCAVRMHLVSLAPRRNICCCLTGHLSFKAPSYPPPPLLTRTNCKTQNT